MNTNTNELLTGTPQEVSIFFFDKRWADRLYSGTKRREAIVEVLRRGVHQLERLSHPRFLTVVHGLEETTDTMAFATEAVLGSLANIMGCLEDRLRQGIPSSLREYSFTEFEHTYGLLQVRDSYLSINEDRKKRTKRKKLFSCRTHFTSLLTTFFSSLRHSRFFLSQELLLWQSRWGDSHPWLSPLKLLPFLPVSSLPCFAPFLLPLSGILKESLFLLRYLYLDSCDSTRESLVSLWVSNSFMSLRFFIIVSSFSCCFFPCFILIIIFCITWDR